MMNSAKKIKRESDQRGLSIEVVVCGKNGERGQKILFDETMVVDSSTDLSDLIVVGSASMNFEKVLVAAKYSVEYGEAPVAFFRLHDLNGQFDSEQCDCLSSNGKKVFAEMGSTIEFSVKNEKGDVLQKLYINNLDKNMIETGQGTITSGDDCECSYAFNCVPINFGKEIGLKHFSVRKYPENDPKFISFEKIDLDINPKKLSLYQTKNACPKLC